MSRNEIPDERVSLNRIADALERIAALLEKKYEISGL